MRTAAPAYKFSVTLHFDSLAFVWGARLFCMFGKNTRDNISWGGRAGKNAKWDPRIVTFRFDNPSYREQVLATAERLLPSGSWSLVDESDSDPMRYSN
jgi:hypothetical protein